jgi:hypothetical protein
MNQLVPPDKLLAATFASPSLSISETRPKQTPNGERDDRAEPSTDSPSSRRFGTQKYDLVAQDFSSFRGIALPHSTTRFVAAIIEP